MSRQSKTYHIQIPMATKLGNLAPTICFSSFSNLPKTSLCITTTTTTTIKTFSHEIKQICRPPLINPVVRATSGRNSVPSPKPPQDDLTYLLKLAAGSVLGAALIKYGSALLPDITKPNIILALLMISTPAVIAVLLLFLSSRKG